MQFFFHYNKPQSRQHKKPMLSLHAQGKCHIVENIVCDVKTYGRIRTKRQPHFVMVGNAKSITITSDRIAYIS